jgi:hypothetical protein
MERGAVNAAAADNSEPSRAGHRGALAPTWASDARNPSADR